MVNVIKDDRTWKIQVNTTNKDCPCLYYPANYYGCQLVPDYEHDDNKGYCTLENCPLKIMYKPTEVKMKDIILMSVTQVIDDDTGIWARDITDFGIYTEIVKEVLRTYRKKGRQSIQKELDYLKKRVDELWDEVLQEEKTASK